MTDTSHRSVTLKRFTKEELAERDRLAGLDEAPRRVYSEEELDALYETDPVEAMRISRAQALEKRRADLTRAHSDAPLPTPEELVEVLERARRILLKDGGDLELVDIQGSAVRVRMKGACVGCPNSVLDLKNVVERIVRERFPQVTEVLNTF